MLSLCEFPSERKLLAAVTQRDGRLASVEVHEEPFSKALPVGVWQRLALVADGTVLHIYRDGVQVASTPCLGVLPNPPMTSLGIGCKTNTAGTGFQADPVQRPIGKGGSTSWPSSTRRFRPRRSDSLSRQAVAGTARFGRFPYRPKTVTERETIRAYLRFGHKRCDFNRFGPMWAQPAAA